MPTLLFSIFTSFCLPSSSVSLPYFILTVPMHKCLGEHLCMSSTFYIAILNGTPFFSSPIINLVLVGKCYMRLNTIIIIM